MDSPQLVLTALACSDEPSMETIMDYLVDVVKNDNGIELALQLHSFLGRPSVEPLVSAVTEADAGLKEKWIMSLLDQYRDEYIVPLINSLNSADVSVMNLGTAENGFRIYMAGSSRFQDGAESFSPSYQLWNTVFSDDNPLCDATFDSCFVGLTEPFMPSTSTPHRYIESVSVATASPAVPPF